MGVRGMKIQYEGLNGSSGIRRRVPLGERGSVR